MDGPVTIERIAWKGWPDAYRLTHGGAELVLVTSIGPRILHCGVAGGPNLFKEFPEQWGKRGEPDFQIRGGHRLWVAPEHYPGTYQPDNEPCVVTVAADSITATGPVEAATGLRKTLAVSASGGEFAITHRVENTRQWNIEIAAWPLTMMAPGGIGISGFPPRGEHRENLLPVNPLVMWAFTDLSDPRYTFTSKYLTLRQDVGHPSPTKIGLFNVNTFGAYLARGYLFVKRYTADPARKYPDFGCSFETFANGDTLELETLGPLTKLGPGEALEQVERWEVRWAGDLAAISDEAIDRLLCAGEPR